jgi:hypothetical protein
MNFELFDTDERESGISILDNNILIYYVIDQELVEDEYDPGFCCEKQCVYRMASSYYEYICEYKTIKYKNIYNISDNISNISEDIKYFIINCETEEEPFIKQNILIRMKSSNNNIDIVYKMITDKIDYNKEIIDKKIENIII